MFNRIGLGTVQLGMRYGIANKFGQPDIEEVNSILDKAAELEISLLDTSAVYGNSEETIGELSNNRFNIVSKWDKNPEQLDQSLGKLNISSLYGWLAHRPDELIQNPNKWAIMQEQLSKGRVKKIGYSLYNLNQLEQLLNKNMLPDLIQIPFNILDKRFTQFFPYLKEIGCEIHCRSLYLQGLFFMKPEELHDFFKPIKNWLHKFQQMAENKDILMKTLISEVLSYHEIDKVIIGLENHLQLKDLEIALLNSKAISIPEIPELSEEIINPSLWPKMK